jgi:hypothetical protein
MVPVTAAQSPGPATRGVEKAIAAGVKIDPRAVPIMAAAPPGSCLNDPTRAGCDTPKAIVADDQLMPDGSTGYAQATPGSARAAQIGFACFVRATDLVKSTGNARAYGANQCVAGVQHQELYVTLLEFWTSTQSWHQMDTGSAQGVGGQTIRASAHYYCRATNTRAWQDQAAGYSETNGVWYAGLNRRYENLACLG